MIHVESAVRTDLLRNLPPFKNAEPGIDRSQFFANFNTSKQGLRLELNEPNDLALARKLADWADVVVESFTPGTMARLRSRLRDVVDGSRRPRDVQHLHARANRTGTPLHRVR